MANPRKGIRLPAKYAVDSSGETGTLTLRGVTPERVDSTVSAAFDTPVSVSKTTLSKPVTTPDTDSTPEA